MDSNTAPSSAFIPSSYHVGGSLLADDPTYVERQADQELYRVIKAGQFCYIFNSRQMGKSSVRVRVMQRLQSEGVACAAIDLSGIGSSQEVTPKKWYAAVIRNLISSFNLGNKINLSRWLREHDSFTLVELLGDFIENILLVEVSQQVVIFFDEIDSILSLRDFDRDDFFAFIRSCYNLRTDKPAFRRLTFVLIGVANPSDLMKDKGRTPFNIGEAIDLTGFTLEEIRNSLGQGIAYKTPHPEAVLREVLMWTGGQPFLTQKICHLIQASPSIIPDGGEDEWVAQLVHEQILYKWESHDSPEHLKTIRDRLLRDNPRIGRMLGLYQQILQQGEVESSETDEEIDLRLSGLVVKQGNKIKSRNRIYQVIFNLDWVENQLENLRPYADAIKQWLASERQSSFYLLEGEALQQALDWAEGKSLGDNDYQFLNASRELEKKRVEEALEVERKAKEAEKKAKEIEREAKEKLEQANQVLIDAQRKAKRTIRRGMISLIAISAAVMTVLSVLVSNARTERDNLEISAKAAEAERKFEADQQIDALLLALEAGQEWQGLNRYRSDEHASPKAVLQHILRDIREQNNLDIKQTLIRDISFRPDFKQIALVRGDLGLELWNSESGQQLPEQSLSEVEGDVFSVNFSPDGKWIVSTENTTNTESGEFQGTAWIWTSEGEKYVELQGHPQRVWSAKFNPEGNQVLTLGEDNRVRIYSISAELLEEFPVQSKAESEAITWLPGAFFIPNSEQILVVPAITNTETDSSYVKFQIYDRSGSLMVESEQIEDANYLDIRADGLQLATSHFDGKIQLWSLENAISGGELKPNIPLLRHSSAVGSLRFSPDGKFIAGVDGNGAAVVWDLQGKQVAELEGDQGGTTYLQFSQDGEGLATVANDGTVRLWNLTKPFPTRQHTSSAVVEFSADGWFLVSAGSEGSVLVHDSSTLAGQAEPSVLFEGEPGLVNAISISPDGEWIVQGDIDGTIRLHNRVTGQEYSTHPSENQIFAVDFSNDGQQFVTAGNDYTAWVWTVSDFIHSSNPEPKSKFLHNAWIVDVDFSPDDNQVVTAGADGRAIVWDIASGTIELSVHADRSNLSAVSFSPKGDQIVTAGSESVVRLWNLDGNLQQELKLESEYVGKFELEQNQTVLTGLSFSPDGQHLVIAGEDGVARLWNLESGQIIDELDAGLVRLISVSFHASGKQVAVGRSDGAVQVWEPQFQNLEDSLEEGCDWLNTYLIQHPTDLIDLEICQEQDTLDRAAPNLVLQAEEFARDGDIERADQLFRIAKQWNSESVTFDIGKKVEQLAVEGLVERGTKLIDESEYERAIQELTGALKLDPNSTEALKQRGRAYRLLERYEEALRDLDRAINRGSEDSELFFTRGEAYGFMLRYDEALLDFTRAIELDPNYAWAIVRRGQVYREMGRYDEALEDFSRTIEIEPNSDLAIAGRGETYRLMGRYDEALADFNRAIDIFPDHVWAIVNRGQVYQGLERYDEALADFSRAIDLDSEDPWPLFIRGETYSYLARYDEALLDLTRAIELDPNYAWAIIRRGQVYREMGRYDEAVEDFSRAIEIEPDSDWAIAERGETYRVVGRYDEAIEDFNRAIDISPDYAWAIGSRGQVYQALGQYEDALEDLNRAIELDATLEWAIEARDEIYQLQDSESRS